MVQIVASDELLRVLKSAEGVVEFVDAQGKRVGMLVRPPSEEDIRLAKQRLGGDANRYTTEEVVEHLRSLEQS